MTHIAPDLVAQALRRSLEVGYVATTRSEVGGFIAMLAASRRGTIVECGTGTGVGAAWLRSGAPDDVTVLTAELDEDLAHSAAEVVGTAGIEVVAGPFRSLDARGPFSLIFADAALAAAADDRDVAWMLLEPTGLLIIDEAADPATSDVAPELADWLSDDRFVCSLVWVAPDAGVLVCARR